MAECGLEPIRIMHMPNDPRAKEQPEDAVQSSVDATVTASWQAILQRVAA